MCGAGLQDEQVLTVILLCWQFSPLVQNLFSGKFNLNIKNLYYIKDSGTTRKILYLLGDAFTLFGLF